MDVNSLVAWLTEGLSPEQAAVVKAAAERDTVKSRVATIKDQTEYQSLLTEQAALKLELEGAPNKPGTRAYQKWYTENYELVKKWHENQAALSQQQQQQQPPQQAASFTEQQIEAMLDKRMNGQYAPKIGGALVATGEILQRHFLAGRKTPINFKEVEDLSVKNGGNLMAAYDEWDRPNREAADKEAREKEIDRRVTEELQKRGATMRFPAAADLGPSSLDARPKAVTDAFDKTALNGELASLWMETQAS